EGLVLTWGFVETDDDGVQYMPWRTDPALRKCSVLVLKVELAEALLDAGVPAADAAAEVNAAIGPPNLGWMGWGSIRTPGGRRTAKHWWHQYQSAVWELSATPPPPTS